MGILNCTPDSFYDGNNDCIDKRVQHALQMQKEGADWIDIGGESTRPGSASVSSEEELKRVIPVIEALRGQSDVQISIDTSKAIVAKEALQAGANMINDVSAGSDPNMKVVAAESHCDITLMHMQGTPKDMQNNPCYENVTRDVKAYLDKRVSEWNKAGVAPHRIILDPGIGFGKTLQHNLSLMANLDSLSTGHRILLGASRKSFIGAIDPNAHHPSDRLPGSLATLVPAITSQVDFVRVHDVKETRQFIDVLNHLLEFRND